MENERSVTVADLRVGAMYVVAGMGEMVLDALLGKRVARMRAHGNGLYWALPSELVREASASDVQLRARQAFPRGLRCTDADCWCREHDPIVPANVIADAKKCAEIESMISDAPAGIAIVHDPKVGFRMYDADAWDRPSETPFLPWTPPPFPREAILAIVDKDGHVDLYPEAKP